MTDIELFAFGLCAALIASAIGLGLSYIICQWHDFTDFLKRL